jgi:hypothetical protein
MAGDDAKVLFYKDFSSRYGLVTTYYTDPEPTPTLHHALPHCSGAEFNLDIDKITAICSVSRLSEIEQASSRLPTIQCWFVP